jgi:hypothetical protein
MSSKKVLAVFAVREGEARAGDEEKKDFWTRIGTAFPHPKGDGFNVLLNALPVNAKLVLLPQKDEPSASEG